MTKLYHRDATSCSFDGRSYDADEDGVFEVPAEAVAPLIDHGFVTDPKLLVTVPDAKLVLSAAEAEKVAKHAKAEVEKVAKERDALAVRAKAMEAERDALAKKLAELEKKQR